MHIATAKPQSSAGRLHYEYIFEYFSFLQRDHSSDETSCRALEGVIGDTRHRPFFINRQPTLAPNFRHLHTMHETPTPTLQKKKNRQRQEAIDRVDSSVQLLEEVETVAQLSSDKSSVQGPDGSPASQTVQSAKMVLTTLRNLQTVLSKIDATYIQHLDMAAMLTLVCEQFFSTMRSRYDMPLALQFARFFSPVVTESLKQRTTHSFQYFLSDQPHYPVPEGAQEIGDWPQVPQA